MVKQQDIVQVLLIAAIIAVPCLSSTEVEVESDGYWTTADGIKKATIVNLLRVMGEARALNVEVPIVFNRNSELFQSYLEQRRTPRKVDYGLPDTLFYGDIKDIEPVVKDKGQKKESEDEETAISHLRGTFVRPQGTGDESTFEYFPATVKPTFGYENPNTTPTPTPIYQSERTTTFKTLAVKEPANGYQFYETTSVPHQSVETTTSYVSTKTATAPENTRKVPVATPTTYETYRVATTASPRTTPKTFMKLVKEQPYSTSRPFYPQTSTVPTANPVTSSYGGRGSVTFLESPASPVKTFSAYQGQLRPARPSSATNEPEFYYKPVVEPVYKPPADPQLFTIKRPTSIVRNPTKLPQPPPPPTPPPSTVRVVNNVYRNNRVEYTTPHPLIYGFKPVTSPFKYPAHVPQRAEQTTAGAPGGHSLKPVRGNFRINYQSSGPAGPKQIAPKPRPTIHQPTKPIRFPSGRIFRSVF